MTARRNSTRSGASAWFEKLEIFSGRTAFEKVVIFAASGAIYAIAWAPVIGQFVVNQHYPAWAVGLLGVAATCLGLLIHARTPRAGLALAVFYWLALLVVNFIFGYVARWMDPAYFLYAIALAAAAFTCRGRPTLLLGALAAATLVLFGFLSYDLYYADKKFLFLTIAATAAILVALVWLSRRERLAHVSRVAFAFCAFAALIYPRGFVAYSFVFPGRLPKVLAQSGVRAIYDYHDKETRDDLCTQAMYLARVPDSPTMVTGPQNPCERLVRIQPGEPPRFSFLNIGSRGGDNIVFDPVDPNTAYIVTIWDILKVSINPLRTIARVHLIDTPRNLNFLQYDAAGDRIFVSQDFGRNIWVIDRKTFALAGSIPTAPGAVTDDVWIDNVGRQVFASGSYRVGWRVDAYDLASLNRRNMYLRPWDIGFHFSTIDPKARRAYLGSTTTGRVIVLDLDTLKEVNSFQLEVGLRNLNFDAARRWVLISGYFSGTLYVYDADRARLLGKLFLGSRLRWVQIDPENGKWYASSSVGGFEIDPERALGVTAKTNG